MVDKNKLEPTYLKYFFIEFQNKQSLNFEVSTFAQHGFFLLVLVTGTENPNN